MTQPGGPLHRVSHVLSRRGGAARVDDDPDTDVLPLLDDTLLGELDAAEVSAPGSGRLPAVADEFDPDAKDDELPPTRIGRRHANRRSAFASRVRKVVVLLTVLLFCSGAVAFAVMKLLHWQGPGKDFSGPPGPTVVVQVRQGDTADQIARIMLAKGVVASTSVFYKAAVRDDAMPALQPGYYALPSHLSGARAVSALVDKSARVGNLVLSGGRQLLDSHDANTGAQKDGIFRKIAEASCYGPPEQRHCVSYDDLAAAGAGSDLAALGVPDWALAAVRQVPPSDHQQQLEGLIAAGTWNFDPTASPTGILEQLITASASQYEATGLLTAGAATRSTPYQMLIAASLVEREALPQDMAKVARVVFNRLGVNQPLEFDSTVNYNLRNTAVATTDADRARVTPWNTYAMPGLPATPISAPSIAALQAVENPAPGPWLYFVTIDKQGTTLFTADYQEHLKNIKLAEESGILDSGH